MDTRSHTSIFKGAATSLGSLNIVGKNVEDFSVDEVAYILGRFMVVNANDNLFEGTLPKALSRIWGNDFWDSFTDGRQKLSQSTFMKKLYKLLRANGFIHKEDEYGNHFWQVTALGDKLRITEVNVRNVKPGPVKIKCLDCKLPFKTSQDLKEHRQSVHKAREKELETVEAVAVEAAIEEAEVTVKVAVDKPETKIEDISFNCPQCGKSGFDTYQKMRSHESRAHKGIKKLGAKPKDLLKVIGEWEGLHPREYAELMGIGGQATSARARSLRDHGLVVAVGNRQSARYYTKNYFKEHKDEILSNGHSVTPKLEKRVYKRHFSVKPAYLMGDLISIEGEVFKVTLTKV